MKREQEDGRKSPTGIVQNGVDCRWFPADKVETRKAEFLDLILYSREQLVKEHDAMPGKGASDALPDAPWGIISVKPQVSGYQSISSVRD